MNVDHQCSFCAEDRNRLGCYCEIEEIITASIFTPCPSSKNINRVFKTTKTKFFLFFFIGIADPCANHSCQNGAPCIRDGLANYKCNCTGRFGGAKCNETLKSKKRFATDLKFIIFFIYSM